MGGRARTGQEGRGQGEGGGEGGRGGRGGGKKGGKEGRKKQVKWGWGKERRVETFDCREED